MAEVITGTIRDIRRMLAICDEKEVKSPVKSPPRTTRINAKRIVSVIKSAYVFPMLFDEACGLLPRARSNTLIVDDDGKRRG